MRNLELTKGVYGPAHLVQLFRADVGAIGKPKINQRPFPQQIFLGEGLVFVSEKREWATDLGSSIGLGRELFLCFQL